MSRLRALLDAFFDLLFPPRANCLGCGNPMGADGQWLCERCLRKYAPLNLTLRRGEWPEYGISCAHVVHGYDEAVRGLVHAFKFRGVYRMAESMAREMSMLLDQTEGAPFDCVTPVPLSARRLRERGYNQSQLLARYIAMEAALPLNEGLTRVRHTHRQSTLSTEERRHNLDGAFRADDSFCGKRVLLVDDVLTTGATANECARALRKANAADVELVVYAASRRKRHK